MANELDNMTFEEADEWAKQSTENFKAWLAAYTSGKLKKDNSVYVESADERAEWNDDQRGF